VTLGASGSNGASPLFNISGIASGIDTNSLVSQLMQIERQPQVRLQNQQTVEQARQQALRDVNTRLSNLQDAIAGLRDPGTWADQQTVDSSDPTHVTATRTGEIQSRLANDVGGVQAVVTDTAASITSNLAVTISTVIAMQAARLAPSSWVGRGPVPEPPASGGSSRRSVWPSTSTSWA